MPVRQILPQRYIDKEKLFKFWRTSDDFKGKPCGMKVHCSCTYCIDLLLIEYFKVDQGFYVVEIPREMTEVFFYTIKRCFSPFP